MSSLVRLVWFWAYGFLFAFDVFFVMKYLLVCWRTVTFDFSVIVMLQCVVGLGGLLIAYCIYDDKLRIEELERKVERLKGKN